MQPGASLLKDLGLPRNCDLDARDLLRLLGRAQDGQFGTRQASALGITRAQILAMRDAGEVAAVRRSVSRFRSTAGEPDPAVTAFTTCWPNGVISHASAAQFHGLSRVASPQRPEVTVPFGTTCRPAGIVVHHSKLLGRADILRVGTLRYTSLARTTCDLACGDDPWETLALVDDAVAAGARPRWIHARALELRAGRDGVALVERATRPGASDEFRSWLERAGAHIFELGGLPPPVWNVEVRDARGRIGIVDALWLPERVVCELKGLRFHSSPEQQRRDDHRVNRLLNGGYGVRSFSWRDVVEDAPGVVATLLRALRAAGARVDLARIPRVIEVPARPFL